MVTGQRVGQADEHEHTITEDGLEFRVGELVPQAGTLTRSGDRGEVVMTFSRTNVDTILVSISGPQGDISIEVEPTTGEVL